MDPLALRELFPPGLLEEHEPNFSQVSVAGGVMREERLESGKKTNAAESPAQREREQQQVPPLCPGPQRLPQG